MTIPKRRERGIARQGWSKGGLKPSMANTAFCSSASEAQRFSSPIPFSLGCSTLPYLGLVPLPA